jgi:hypothetical protein
MIQREIMKQRKTFEEMLLQSDDQVFVRHLLNAFVSDDLKKEMLKEYNKMVAERNALKGFN